MDTTPFMKGHACVLHAHLTADQVAFDGTFAVWGNMSTATDAEILASDEDDLATYFESVANSDGLEFSVPGATNDGIDEYRETKLRRWMYAECSAYTAGGVEIDVII